MPSLRTALTAALLPLTVLLVAGCSTDNPAPDGTPSATPTSTSTSLPSTPTPSPTAMPTAASRIPTACEDLVDSGTYAATFGDVPLNDPAFVGDRPSGDIAPGDLALWFPDEDAAFLAGSELFCLWGDPAADVTSLSVAVSAVTPEAQTAQLGSLADKGYRCAERGAGQQCALTQKVSPYDVDQSFTYYAQDDVVVLVSQTNFPTDNLMRALIDRIWGAA